MTAFLHRIFIQNWQRKAISALLAVIIWFSVSHSLTTTKTIGNIPVRIINVPLGKTVEGLQNNGLLSKRITLSLVGNKTVLEDLTSNDLEVVIDAGDKSEEWIASVSKKNLISLSPEIDLSKGIFRISHQSFIIRLSKLVSEKIPVLITRPVGDPPRDYQFLDIWPGQLNLSVSGPEEMIKQLKAKGVKLTFNLHQISKAQLDTLGATHNAEQSEVVSFTVPDQWKRVELPLLCDSPVEINDPQAKALRIDFIRSNLLALEKPLPVELFVPTEHHGAIKPSQLTFLPSSLIEKNGRAYFLTPKLSVKGISPQFLQIVKEMLQLIVIVSPTTGNLEWSVQCAGERILEDRYVSLLLSDTQDEEIRDLQPALREEYLRNRFRNYMNRIQLCWPDESRLNLKIELKSDGLLIHAT